MVDPVTLTALAIGGLAGTTAGQALSSSGGGSSTAAATPAAPAAPAPQQTAGAKPKAKASQPSFLAGASMLPQGGAASGGPQGKSLLGQ